RAATRRGAGSWRAGWPTGGAPGCRPGVWAAARRATSTSLGPPSSPDLMAATFSIRIPLYNGGATIERTLRSLVAQSDPDWECRVVDDASTDDSVLRARWVEDDRIQVDATQQNVGMAANWNRALADLSG